MQAFVLPTVYRDSDEHSHHPPLTFKSALPPESLMNLPAPRPALVASALHKSPVPSLASSSTGHEPTLTSASSISSNHLPQRSTWAASTSLTGRNPPTGHNFLPDGSQSDLQPFDTVERLSHCGHQPVSLTSGHRSHDSDPHSSRQSTEPTPILSAVKVSSLSRTYLFLCSLT